MKCDLNRFALFAAIMAAPGFAAEPDPHAGYHPAPSTSTPALPPKADAAPSAPPADDQNGRTDRSEGMGMMKRMGADSPMPMLGMMGGSMPTESHQRMMDHMATMHGMSSTEMTRDQAAPMWEHVDACLAFLKSELKITAAQAKAWDAFANRLRASAATMRNLHSSMTTGKVADGSLAQRLDHQERWFAAALENVRSLKPVVDELYATLSDEQRMIANVVIPPHLDLMQTM